MQDTALHAQRPVRAWQMNTAETQRLNEHIRRVNYQLAIWKRAHCSKPDVPHAAADHRSTMNDGKLQPCWFKGAVLPKSTTDILGAIDKDEMADVDSTDDDYESDSNADDDDSDSD